MINYKREYRKKIRNLRSSSPKDYWNYINSLNKQKTTPNVDMSVFYEYYKTLNKNNVNVNHTPEPEYPNVEIENNLDEEITMDEIRKVIHKLKSNKASGLDKITNEYIKNSCVILLPLYHRLFNTILNTGCLPDSWLVGCIVPIYKNKGSVEMPENYRPITLLSCMGKVFTAILNARLTAFLESNNLLNENQAGFRKNHSTIDNIFILHMLAEYLKSRNCKLFCTFIDFQKAFDSVWRAGLWSKIMKYNISGKFLYIIRSMYDNIKSCVSVNGSLSDFFCCSRGLRQGENLSPILFLCTYKI